ncbi:MAG: hypothetical protein AAGF11_44810 [Myxococcota bacterium]
MVEAALAIQIAVVQEPELIALAGRIFLAAGRPTDALAVADLPLKRELRCCESAIGTQELRLLVAASLDPIGRDPERASRLASRARARFAQLNRLVSSELADAGQEE